MKWLKNFKEKKSSMLQYILKMWMLKGMESIDHLQQGHKMNLHQRYKMNLKTCNHNIMCKNLKNILQMFIGQDLLVWWTYLSIRQNHFDQAMANDNNGLQMFMAQDLLVWWIYMKIQWSFLNQVMANDLLLSISSALLQHL